ncbi:MAG TPA: gamma-glutamyl-gamma-aminobutyrate hydrolase family protein, partial [Candidatus Binatus sp.]|nr:gamma-glutamyl-gamma-aminobutyrate hydrolase family protein [Candidatus Binatus sp.]
ICGKYAGLQDSYVSVNEALRHAGACSNARVNLEWIETDGFERDPGKLSILSKFDGVLVPGGFGFRGAEGKIKAIEYARTHNIPLLGICFGFQLAVVEYARSIGVEDATSSEFDSEAKNPVIDLMPEQGNVMVKGGTMRLGAHEIIVKGGTMASALYGKTKIWERHRHRYEVNQKYIQVFETKGLIFSGNSDNGRRMEILELPSNRFHLATQYHAEFKSRLGRPSPPYLGFVRASLKRRPQLMKTPVVSTHETD